MNDEPPTHPGIKLKNLVRAYVLKHGGKSASLIGIHNGWQLLIDTLWGPLWVRVTNVLGYPQYIQMEFAHPGRVLLTTDVEAFHEETGRWDICPGNWGQEKANCPGSREDAPKINGAMFRTFARRMKSVLKYDGSTDRPCLKARVHSYLTQRGAINASTLGVSSYDYAVETCFGIMLFIKVEPDTRGVIHMKFGPQAAVKVNRPVRQCHTYNPVNGKWPIVMKTTATDFTTRRARMELEDMLDDAAFAEFKARLADVGIRKRKIRDR